MTALSRYRGVLEPLLAVLYLVFWVVTLGPRFPADAILVVAMSASIAAARVAPRASLILVAALVVAHAVGIVTVDERSWLSWLGGAFVIGLVTASARRLIRFVALGVGVVAVPVTALRLVLQEDSWVVWTGQGAWLEQGPTITSIIQLSVYGIVLVGLCWSTGFAFSARVRLVAEHVARVEVQDQLEVSEVERIVSEERNRIAQEMHDVLAHSLAVIVAQADGARFVRLQRPEAVDGALSAISDSARNALLDVRGMIDGILDGEAPPQPSLGDLGELVAGIRSAGVEVAMTERGDRVAMGAGRQVTVYRIIQEGLTNVLRHRGRGATATLELDWRGAGLSIELHSSGGELADEPTSGGGRGVAGMTERARLAGGLVSAETDADGIHRVSGFIPFHGALDTQPIAIVTTSEPGSTE